MRKYLCKFCGVESKCQYAHEKHLKENHLDETITCERCGTKVYDIKALMSHITRAHGITKEAYWQEHIFTNDALCPKSKDTNENLTYTEYTKQHGYKIRSNYYHSNKEIETNFICEICNVGFEQINHLAKHLTDSHPNINKEEYYKTHFWKEGDPDGKCLECGKELKFIGLKDGYQKFCYNTDCNVNYYNKHSGRHLCGETISKGQKRTQNMPNQIGYWTKKGYTEEQAKALVTERQTTNSLEKIMKREKCSLKEAKSKRKEITKKRMSALDNKSPEEKERIALAKVGHGFTISKAEKEIFEILKTKFDVIHSYVIRGDNRGYVFDIQYKNKLIEYNGDYYHCNPKIYKPEYYNKRIHKYSKEKWLSDAEKNNFAKKMGFDVLVIWENDYKTNKDETIQKCLGFLNE